MGSDLGKLEGFISTGTEVPFFNPNDVVIVGLDAEATQENWFSHCARLEDETDEDLAGLIDAIRRTGKVDDPIDVFRDGTRVCVLDGRRRTRAARIVWKEQEKEGVSEKERVKVRAVIRRGSPEELFRYNVDSHEKKLLNPLQKARLVINFFNSTGESVERTVEFFRLSPKAVRYHLKASDFSSKLQRAVALGKIGLQQAAKLAVLPREEQNRGYDELEAAGATKGAAANNGVASLRSGKKIEGADHTRTRSRTFLEKLRDELRTTEYKDLSEWLDFILGGPVPAGVPVDLTEVLTRAGYKPNRTKVEYSKGKNLKKAKKNKSEKETE